MFMVGIISFLLGGLLASKLTFNALDPAGQLEACLKLVSETTYNGCIRGGADQVKCRGVQIEIMTDILDIIESKQ